MDQIITFLLLIGLANGIPIVVTRILGERLAYPADFHIRLHDGNRLFGKSKTLRGIAASLLGTTLVAPVFGYTILVGFVAAVFSMLGDVFSSFVKRRMGQSPSSMSLGLDQVPESLFPTVACMPLVGLSFYQVTLIVVLFFVLELAFSYVLYKLRIRNRPY